MNDDDVMALGAVQTSALSLKTMDESLQSQLDRQLALVRDERRRFNAFVADGLCRVNDDLAREFGSMLTAFEQIAAMAASAELLEMVDQCRGGLNGVHRQMTLLASQIREQV